MCISYNMVYDSVWLSCFRSNKREICDGLMYDKQSVMGCYVGQNNYVLKRYTGQKTIE